MEFEQEIWEGDVVYDFIIAHNCNKTWEEYLTHSACGDLLERW